MKEIAVPKVINTGFGPADLRVVACNLATPENDNLHLRAYAKGLDGAHSAEMSIGDEGRYKGLRFQYRNRDVIIPRTDASGRSVFSDKLTGPLTYQHTNLVESNSVSLFPQIEPPLDSNPQGRLDVLEGPSSREIVPDLQLMDDEQSAACATYKNLLKVLEQVISSDGKPTS